MCYTDPPFGGGLIKEVRLYQRQSKSVFEDRFLDDACKNFDKISFASKPVRFFSSAPRYSAMDKNQSEFYFYLRECIRGGKYPAADAAYLFLFAFEVIALTPKKISPDEGVRLLCDVWLAYRTAYPALDTYFGEWVCDYCLIHRVAPPYEKMRPALFSIIGRASFGEFYLPTGSDVNEPFSEFFISALGGYDHRRSKFYAENRESYERYVVPAASGALFEMQNDGYDMGFNLQSAARESFVGAPCPDAAKYRIEISYLCVAASPLMKIFTGDVLKLAENELRRRLGISAMLRTSVAGRDAEQYTKECFEKLYGEGDASGDMYRFVCSLSKEEHLALLAALGADAEAFCETERSFGGPHGELLSKINAAAKKMLGDEVLGQSGDTVFVLDEYIDAVTEAVIKKEEEL